MENWKQVLYRWCLSTAITFSAAFALAILPHIDTITMASIQDGSIFGLIFVAARQGIKAVLELAVAGYQAYQASKK